MAYLNLLAAVDPEQVAQLRGDSGFRMTPSKVVGVSHLLGNPGWVTHAPLVAVLAEALDGGELLTGSLWHPLRVPMYHPPGEVLRLAPPLEEVWGATLAKWPLPKDDWYRIEIEKVLAAFHHAATVGEGIASILDPPFDQKRASRVVIPLVAP